MRWGRRLEDGSVHSQAEASGQLGLDSEMSPTGYQYAYLGVVNLGRWRPQDISFEARSREFKSRRPHHLKHTHTKLLNDDGSICDGRTS